MKGLLTTALGLAVVGFAPAWSDGYFDPLTIAAIQGDAVRVEVLLDAGADPNARSWLGLTPLAAAMRSCRMNEEVLDALVAHGADIEARSGAGVTPLMVAWQSRRADLASALIAAGADQDARNMYGDTVAEYRAHFAGDRAQSDIAAVKHLAFGAAQIATDPITLCERPAG